MSRFVILSLFVAMSVGLAGRLAWAGQTEGTFERDVTTKVRIRYLLSVPDDYSTSDKSYPLLMFLHGSGESGDDLQKVKAHGPPKLIDAGKSFPFIVVSPQASRRGWNPESLDALLTDLLSTYRVDRDRVYLTGLSMGGSGTWQFASSYPHRFAAIAPICGGARIDAATIKDLPTWVFHGAKDEAVPVARSRELVAALKELGAKEVKYTEYPNAGHDSWTESYNNPELYTWLLSHSRSAASPAKPVEGPSPRLIVRGDDMGFSHSGNEALIKCYTSGIETSIEVIVPSPWFPEAVRLLEQHPTVDVGVHLALTSEWDNVKWRPLTNSPSLKDADGTFYPMIHPNPNYPKRSLKENGAKLEEIEKEFRAQIELAKKLIPRVSHVSGHMGCNQVTAECNAMTRKLAKEYGLDIDLGELGVKNVGFMGKRTTSEEKFDSFIKMLDSLEAGKTYLFVEHPGFDTPELRAIHHIGYENVAVDRQGVTDTWTDPRIKAAIDARKIQLISYKDLKK